MVCSSALTIKVAMNDASRSDLILGVESDPALGDTLEMTLGTVAQPGSNVPPRIIFDNATQRLSETAPCTVSLASFPAEGRRFALHARVGTDKRVILTVNGKTQINFVVGPGAVVYDGRLVLDKAPFYALKAVAAVYTRAFQNPVVEISRSPSGRYVITPRGFQNHLMETEEVRFASGGRGQCCTNPTLVSFSIEVSPEGQVMKAVPVHVPPEQLASLSRIVMGLKLKPFVANGAPVAAEGLLTLLVEPSGKAWYPD